MPGWTLATWRPSTGAEWIGRRAPRGTAGARPARCCRPSDPFYEPPPGFQHAAPAPCCARATSSWRFSGLIPQRIMATQLLYRTTDMNGQPGGDGDDGDRARRAHARRPCPVVSYQCAIDAVSSRCFPSYALRRRAQGRRLAGSAGVSADRRRPGRGLGGVGTRPRGPQRHVGRALRARLPRSRRRCAPR